MDKRGEYWFMVVAPVNLLQRMYWIKWINPAWISFIANTAIRSGSPAAVFT